jgi:formylglycine-generating enzyme required for sulfatase activity
MLAQMFVTTLPAMGAGEEEGSLPVLQGVAEPKKTDESQHFTFKEHNGNHYTGQYRYGDKKVPFSADLMRDDGKLLLTGEVTLPEPIEPEPFTMTLKGDRGWVLKIFGSEFEMIFRNIPFRGENYTVQLPQGVPLDMVWIDKGYWIGKYEVTQAQYQAIMGTNPSRFRGTDLPVEGVSWHNAMTFCDKLTAIEKATGRLPTGYKYTLPTEGQREYACRAGTTGDYNVDGVELSELAWYDANSGGTTHPVGQKKPNAWGLYDMHGNVFEWCLDWLKVGEERVMRGGSWFHNANYCRSASRSGGPDGWHSYRGFRVVLVPVK